MRVSFTEHPSAVGETYGEHFQVAMRFSWAMLRGGLGCMVHAVLPFCCTSTGSQTIRRLHGEMVTGRQRSAAGVPDQVTS